MAGSGDARVTPAVQRLVLAVFTLSGFASLALEVIWFRVIVLVARPTVYTFAMILSSVLFGIAFGSYLVTPLMRRKWHWVAILAGVEIAMSATILLSLATLGSVNTVNAWIEPAVAAVLPPYLSYSIAAAVPAVLPTCILMGMAFPIGLKLWAGDGRMSRVATFYSLNLAGAIGGSIAAGFLFLPWWGSLTSLIVVAGIVLASGLSLLLAALTRPALRAMAAVALPAIFLATASRIADPYDAFLSLRWPSHGVLWREEAVQGTVSVHDHGNGRRGLYLDGNHQASDSGTMVFNHRLLANLPMALHPAARSVLVVGLGGGATPGAVSAHDGVEVDVVELSESVVRAAPFFSHVNFDVVNRPNVHVRVDDGRNYLLLTPRKYDVVTADIILPIHAGSNNIYSREYFTLVRNALKPDGLAMQWVFGTDAEHKTIARTFLSVFPNATLWGDGTVLIGSIQPLTSAPRRLRVEAPVARAPPGARGSRRGDVGKASGAVRCGARRAPPLRRRGSDSHRRPAAGGVLPFPATGQDDGSARRAQQRRRHRRAVALDGYTGAQPGVESLRARRSTLPTMVFGRSARNSIDAGTL